MTKTGWPAGFLEGVRLFNQGHFFETHEVWEDVWRSAPAEERDFYQGMIHLTVALYQAGRANWRAAHSQLRRAAKRLERYEPRRGELACRPEALAGGLDVRGLRAAVVEAIAQLEAGSDSARFPKINFTPAASLGSPPTPGQ